MKKQIHILEGIIILTIIFIAGLLPIKFNYTIRHEKLDTKYMWDISLTNIKIEEGSNPADITSQYNTLNLDVILKKEGDYFYLTFDIENNGSLDASLKAINYNVSNPSNLLTYSITYNDNEKINEGDILKSHTKKTVHIRAYYPPQEKKIYESLELKLSLVLNYIAIYPWFTS